MSRKDELWNKGFAILDKVMKFVSYFAVAITLLGALGVDAEDATLAYTFMIIGLVSGFAAIIYWREFGTWEY